MHEPLIYPTEGTAVLGHASQALRHHGIAIAEALTSDVTHILLPIPQGTIPECLPEHITIIGGNIDIPQHRCMDLLKDESYLAKNAMITAHIAVNLAAERLPIILEDTPVLIVGWGRIGKCLMKLLQSLGADVTVAARKPSDLGMISALGCQATAIHRLSHILRRYRLIFNTVPFPVLDANQCSQCRPDCIKIDLASQPGIAVTDVIHARGLPGKYAPESSGKLIAQTVLRLLNQQEVLS